MADWTFRFVDDTTRKDTEEKLSSVIPETFGSGVNQKASKKQDVKSKEQFSETFSQKMQEDSIQSFLISPLNTVTGGLASPLYASGRRIIQGATIGAVAGDLVATVGIMGIQAMISGIQTRMQEIEQKVADLNNADNVLLRAGSVSKAKYYSGNIFGVKTRTDRS